MNKYLLPLLLLLPSCSLIFATVEDEVTMGADSGTPDTISAALDGGADGGQTSAPDAALCDPFTEAGCYVQNWPLGGPDFEPIGVGAVNSACTESNDCAPFMFCTGVGGTAGDCLELCDEEHQCPGAINCLSTNWQDFGFCERQFQ